MDSTKESGDVSSDNGFLLRVGLNDNKAGMQGLDKEKINKIIMEATKVCLYNLSLVLAIDKFLCILLVVSACIKYCILPV